MSKNNLHRLMRREIKNLKDVLTGTVISELRLLDFDGNNSGVWVCDVEIGSNNYLKDVPVKALSNRFHAQLGQTVALQKNAQGRFEVIGPGLRVSKPVTTKYYNLATQIAGASIDTGFRFDRVPFSFYATVSGGLSYWDDGDPTHPFNLVRIVDANGNPV